MSDALNTIYRVSVGPHSVPMVWEPDKLLALALSRPSEALAAAREVLAQRPSASQAAVAHQAAGVVLRDFGDIGEAIEEFKNARRFARKAGNLDRESDVLGEPGYRLGSGRADAAGPVGPRHGRCATAAASLRAGS